ncbi:hypothetical protein LF1_17310 [Rubripirellula obstinata]|uniref:Uncharacterized protein n=1 Tax=Rubripirellula obstinata TaxID=406547 RepID=A0A5B1CG93_9BACT|nr:hypothetical protein [Rubripirellula obstinata]KAA1259202.1 hypothetical protein LF1_17310 [Rubripirellula obstinata]
MVDPKRFDSFFFANHQAHHKAMQQLIQSARSGWQGCDWPTRFGPKKLDLQGIRSRQARLAQKATRGEEAACWAAAVVWLTEVEADAAQAADFASQALAESEKDCWVNASDLLQQAESLEAEYGQLNGYHQVREAFQRWFASHSSLA